MTDAIVETRSGSAAELHALEPEPDGALRIWVLEVTGPAVVLGSTQPTEVVDDAAAAALGVAVVRRRSGGGAVWVAPDEPVWLDVIVPRAHPLWTGDVGRSFLPIGEAWRQALVRLGVAGPSELAVHSGPMVRSAWSPLVCFAGRGPGEVLLEGRKVVGISQRRNRDLARFQCAVPRLWDPAPLVAVLDPTHLPPGEPIGELTPVGAGIGDIPTAGVVAAFVAALT